jgi:hypothetical protein
MSLDIMKVFRMIKFKNSITFSKTYSDELLNHPSKLCSSGDQVITQKEIDKLQTGISTIQFENRWICKDKSVKWLYGILA